MLSSSPLHIAISWHSLPPYAARLIQCVINEYNGKIDIIATHPPVFLDEVEKIIKQPIIWIDSDSSTLPTWSSLGLDVPDIFFQSGWLSQKFNFLGKQVKESGGKVICFSDNRWKNTPRQWLAFLVFRLKLRSLFDGVWVPGKSGKFLMRFYGVPEEKIYTGMYGATSVIFNEGIPLVDRPQRFLFVGQIIRRKGINTLLNAFNKFHQNFSGWQLSIVGTGNLDNIFSAPIPGIEWKGLQSPEQIADLMKNSRFLILPSYEDSWGLVVHEATLCGCGLILSNSVGSSLDLLSKENGFLFKSKNILSLYHALVLASQMNKDKLQSCMSTSLRLSSEFGVQKWSEIFSKIIVDLKSLD